MRVSVLQVLRFRNLAPLTLEPSPGLNVFHGDNGQGKTNLLEALYLVGTLRSFRTHHAQEMIQLGEADASVRARVDRRGLDRIYEVALAPGRKQAKLDGKSPPSLGAYFGDFNVVLFAPEDLRVPRGSPAGRRRFLDRSVFNRHVTYLELAQRYQRILRSRNVLLRGAAPGEDLLAVYDEQLAALGDDIVRLRRAYLAELLPRFRASFESITRTGIEVALEYQAPDLPMAEALAGARRRDVARRQTTVGPHVHDVEFVLGGNPARVVASQGQLRALVLAWKTAEMRLLREALGETPVLLLDDVSSELDPDRSRFLFEFLAELDCQRFVTTTHPQHVPAAENRKDFPVVNGAMRG